MAKDVVGFVKLNENNYLDWKYTINVVLRAIELDSYVFGDKKQPNKLEKPAEWKAWKMKSLKSLYIIMDSVERRLHRYLLHCESGREAWNEIKLMYGETHAGLVPLWQEFHEFRFKDGVKVTEQVDNFGKIASKLIAGDAKLDDAAIQAKLLSVLPKAFFQVRIAWDLIPPLRRNLDDLYKLIMAEEKHLAKKLKELESLKCALKRVKIEDSGDQTEQHKKIGNGKKKLDSEQRTRCSICEERGHKAEECALKKRAKTQVIASVSGVCHKTADSDEDAWLADTSASTHMTFRKDFFISYEPLSENLYLKVAGDRFLEVLGHGTIIVTEKIGGKIQERKMHNVLLVPELKKNLFSVSAIIEEGYSFYTVKTYCEVRNSENNLVHRGVKKNRGFFKMLFKIKSPASREST
ncbi:hypothetical protein TSAR_002841 [Trichomalopsis sarcophagae]|uniref:Retrovirus-related Pol polyprotein from transposon TNT 1-94-like beta-barrel domain-containing protein n=1 Tax=Trichomalopsis sarcophagae TaxID=543379 RepID=A0A232F2P0_9HYME|nr:hypothetical protein TSAR_002841 [Trichomalopsis sarcophagae]